MPQYNIDFICDNEDGTSFLGYMNITADDTIQAHEIALDRFKRDTRPLIYNIIGVRIEYNGPYVME